ncbi:RHS repeat domain-containing protein [Mucilaginibacter sabulilitoris]|uniref:RHS repeat domain-containing protein n=1 Tax=Mucilaginibacter sabulilitoris TaxID=1173583 RepID=A0ABZ0THP2_9SPHI|nr:RHS repeat domain-containing protein [Mucilaginibacter sabulilitoris]WPU92472.1 RHS repeat domain-containing protein [Mucilaginibacter sabulilitoris]
MKIRVCRAIAVLMLSIASEAVNGQQSIPNQIPLNYADITGKELLTSPTTTAFTQYGKVPVSLFTGAADISIPLYDIKVDDFDMPVSLSYSSTGIQPNSHASWVGTGWNLMAGATITRKVNGSIDEFIAPYDYADNVSTIHAGDHLGWYFSSIEHTNPTNNSAWTTNIGNGAFYPGMLYIDGKSLIRDYAADEFDFNIFGLSGAFFMGEDGNWKVRSKDGKTIKIEEIYDRYVFKPFPSATGVTGVGTFIGFKITTGDGTQYYFGDYKKVGSEDNVATNTAIEFNRAGLFFSIFNNNVVATAWHIRKITLPNKKEIIFDYFRDGNQYIYSPSGNSEQYNVTYSVPWGIGSVQNAFYQEPIDANVNIIDPVYLRSISFPQGKLVLNSEPTFEPDNLESTFSSFNYFTTSSSAGARIAHDIYGAYPEITPPNGSQLSAMGNGRAAPSNWYKLNSIELQDYNGKKLKEAKFTYNQPQLPSNTRYFLQSVQAFGYYNNPGGISMPPYTFQYNSTVLPKYCSINVDHWGYYTGLRSFPTIAPGSPNSVSDYNAFRTPDATFVKAGILTQINYPTGGYTMFEYQPNKFKSWVGNYPAGLNILGTEATGGGVRVSKITSTDNVTGKPLVFEYSYVNDLATNVSSGVLGSPLPEYIVNQPNLSFYNAPGYSAVTMSNVSYWYFTSNNKYPVHNNDGTIVTYTKVIERQSANGVYNGMKATTFTNHDNGYMDHTPDAYLYMAPTDGLLCNYTDRSFERGNVLTEFYYNNNSRPVQSVENTYNDDPGRFNAYVKSILTSAKIIPSNGNRMNFFRISAVRNYTFYPFLKRRVETVYPTEPLSANTVTTTDYTYDPGNSTRNLVQQAVQNSSSEKLITNYIYPKNYTVASNTDDFSKGVKNLQDNYAVSVPVELYNQRVNTNGTGLRTISASLNSYNSTLPLPDLSYVSESINPVTSFVPSTINTSGQLTKDPSYKPRMSVGNYDAFGHALQMHQTNGTLQAFQWGYNNNYPTVTVANAANLSVSTDNIVTDQGTGYIRLTNGSTTTYTTAFDMTATGTISMSLGFTGNPGTNGSMKVSVIISGPSTTGTTIPLCVSSPGGNCGSYSTAWSNSNFIPGHYIVTAQIYESQNTGSDVGLGIFYPVSTTVTTITGTKDFYYEGFEEGGGNSTINDARTGHLSYTGAYTKNLNGLSVRNYVLSYWLKSGNSWTLQTQSPVSVTGGSYTINIPSGQIDDVRFCPSDAQMTTYTYDPLVGMTSATDAKGITTTYEYDSFQRLKNVKDEDGHVVKHTDYHYAGQ